MNAKHREREARLVRVITREVVDPAVRSALNAGDAWVVTDRERMLIATVTRALVAGMCSPGFAPRMTALADAETGNGE
jgi:hypothetical protein